MALTVDSARCGFVFQTGEPGVSVYPTGEVTDLPVFWLVITALV